MPGVCAVAVSDRVELREVVASDLPAVDRLWRSDDWDFGIDALRFLTDQDACPHKGFAAVFKKRIIGKTTSPAFSAILSASFYPVKMEECDEPSREALIYPYVVVLFNIFSSTCT